MTPEKERRKLVAAVREMVGLLSAEELADLIEHIKGVIRTADPALLPEFTNVVLLTPLQHGDQTLPAGARGTIVSVFPATNTYTVEFFEPRCVIPAVPALALAAGTIDEQVATLMTAYDRERGRAFLRETAIEMYLADGHPRDRAERMADDLLQSEMVDLFGGREMLVTDDTTDAELSAFMRGKRRVPTKLLNPDIDWSGCPAVQRRSGRLGGAWTVRGTRILVAGLIENYNAGYGPEALPLIFHGLSIDVAREIIAYAAKN